MNSRIPIESNPTLPKKAADFRAAKFIKHGVCISVGYMEWCCFLFHNRCTPVMFTFFTAKESLNADSIAFLQHIWKPQMTFTVALCDGCGRDLFS